MQIGLMVEGQDSLTWERWRHILALAERLRFPTLFRSDHYFIRNQQESLEAYLSFVLAAVETEQIRFGPLVTPVTFRRPVDVGRMAAQLDALSDGRFVMGLGAGWNEPEHRAYGLDFPSIGERFDRLTEAIALIQTLWTEGPAHYAGRYYQLDGADCQPHPPQGRPPLLIGGGGERRTLRLVAEHAQEWNCTMLSPEAYAAKLQVLERHCEAVRRDPATIRKSMMMFGLIGPAQSDAHRAAEWMMSRFRQREHVGVEEFLQQQRARGAIVGDAQQVIDQLGLLAELGLDEIQFQHFFFDSDEIPEFLASEVASRAAAL